MALAKEPFLDVFPRETRVAEKRLSARTRLVLTDDVEAATLLVGFVCHDVDYVNVDGL